jgi:hypothetical protein
MAFISGENIFGCQCLNSWIRSSRLEALRLGWLWHDFICGGPSPIPSYISVGSDIIGFLRLPCSLASPWLYNIIIIIINKTNQIMLRADLKKHCILEPICIQSLARDRRGGDKKNMLLCPSSFFLKKGVRFKTISYIFIFLFSFLQQNTILSFKYLFFIFIFYFYFYFHIVPIKLYYL